jgi:hypothetical protein
VGGSLDFRDPWGNHVQVVDYRDIQFTKTAGVLRGMKLEALSKSEEALAELRAKGLGPGLTGVDLSVICPTSLAPEPRPW